LTIPDEAVEAAAKVIHAETYTDLPHDPSDYLEMAKAVLEAAASYMHRTITTVEELDALEVTAVIRGKWLAEKWADPEGDMWHVAGKGMNWDTEQLAQRGGLPATVLLEVRK
jgi:hypothetical protein